MNGRSRESIILLLLTASMLGAGVSAAAGGAAEDTPDENERTLEIDGDRRERIDELIDSLVEPDEPGIAVAVVDDSGLRYRRDAGVANLDYGVPITAETRFYAAQLSRQVTGAAAAVLMRDGELDSADRVAEILDDWPEWAEDVTVGHLLRQSAGLPDYFELIEVADISVADPLSLEDYLDTVYRAEMLTGRPGSSVRESSSNYMVLAAVIEEVAGTRFDRFAERELFEPMGMDDTHVQVDRRRVVAQRAIGYELSGDEWAHAYLNTWQGYGDGGVYTTVSDWIRWDRLRREDPLDIEAVMRSLIGRDGRYAFGLRRDKWNSYSWVGHSARFMGFRHDYRYFPEVGASIIVFSNRDDLVAGRIAEQIATILLEEELARLVEPYSGTFYNGELDVEYRLTREGHSLYLERPGANRIRLSYTGASTWRAGSWRFSFSDVTADGEFRRFRLSTGRVRDMEFIRRTGE